MFAKLKNNRLRYLKWLLISLSLLFAAYWVRDYQRIKPDDKKGIVKKEKPMLLTAPVMWEFNNEKLKLHLVADTAQVFEEIKLTRLINLTALLYEEDGANLSAHIVAEYGEYKAKSDLLRLWGNVRIELKEGQKLYTEELFVNRKQELVYNTVKVKAISGKDIINGASMKYQINKGILLLNKPRAKIEI
jgi:LPS export ABC transporter protein LptC